MCTWWINNTGFLAGPQGVISIGSCSTHRRTRAYQEAIATLFFSSRSVSRAARGHFLHAAGGQPQPHPARIEAGKYSASNSSARAWHLSASGRKGYG